MSTSVKKGISILLEGLDGIGKTTQSHFLRNYFDGILLKTPPEIIVPYRNYFVNEKPEYREVYYMLGNIISFKEMKRLTESGTNVIIDRSFLSTLAYIYGKDLSYPIPDTQIEWSHLIEKPDYMFFLRLNNKTRLQRLIDRGDMTEEDIYIRNNPTVSERINLMYERLGCIPIDIEDDWSPERVFEEIIKNVMVPTNIC